MRAETSGTSDIKSDTRHKRELPVKVRPDSLYPIDLPVSHVIQRSMHHRQCLPVVVVIGAVAGAKRVRIRRSAGQASTSASGGTRRAA